MMQQNPPLHIEALHKSYGATPVLHGVDVCLKPGEIFGLIGLNGIGKTTLIKILLDLLGHDAGNITLFGEPHHQARARRNLYYLPEKFMPSPVLKGHEFLALSMAFHGHKYNPKEAEALATKLDLNPEALKSPIRRYSKGMGQKLGLIAALLSEAGLLVLDEPMSGLDPKARAYLKRALLRYRDAGKTVFFSSHILADMDEICDRIAILHNGRILFTGTVPQFKHTHHAEGKSLEDTFLELLENA